MTSMTYFRKFVDNFISFSKGMCTMKIIEIKQQLAYIVHDSVDDPREANEASKYILVTLFVFLTTVGVYSLFFLTCYTFRIKDFWVIFGEERNREKENKRVPCEHVIGDR